MKPTLQSIQDSQLGSRSSIKPSLEDELKSLDVNSQETEHDSYSDEVGQKLLKDVEELEIHVDEIVDNLTNTRDMLQQAVRYSGNDIIEYPAYMSLWSLQDALLFSSFISL